MRRRTLLKSLAAAVAVPFSTLSCSKPEQTEDAVPIRPARELHQYSQEEIKEIDQILRKMNEDPEKIRELMEQLLELRKQLDERKKIRQMSPGDLEEYLVAKYERRAYTFLAEVGYHAEVNQGLCCSGPFIETMWEENPEWWLTIHNRPSSTDWMKTPLYNFDAEEGRRAIDITVGMRFAYMNQEGEELRPGVLVYANAQRQDGVRICDYCPPALNTWRNRFVNAYDQKLVDDMWRTVLPLSSDLKACAAGLRGGLIWSDGVGAYSAAAAAWAFVAASYFGKANPRFSHDTLPMNLYIRERLAQCHFRGTRDVNPSGRAPSNWAV